MYDDLPSSSFPGVPFPEGGGTKESEGNFLLLFSIPKEILFLPYRGGLHQTGAGCSGEASLGIYDREPRTGEQVHPFHSTWGSL